ncbi:hypothetical protein [Saccharopolyspora spinosa]
MDSAAVPVLSGKDPVESAVVDGTDVKGVRGCRRQRAGREADS